MQRCRCVLWVSRLLGCEGYTRIGKKDEIIGLFKLFRRLFIITVPSGDSQMYNW